MTSKRKRFVVIGRGTQIEIRDMKTDGYYSESGLWIASFATDRWTRAAIQRICDELNRREKTK